MTRLWRIVLTAAAFLLAAGVVLGGAGYITGASPERVVQLAFGGTDGLLAALSALKDHLLQLLPL